MKNILLIIKRMSKKIVTIIILFLLLIIGLVIYLTVFLPKSTHKHPYGTNSFKCVDEKSCVPMNLSPNKQEGLYPNMQQCIEACNQVTPVTPVTPVTSGYDAADMTIDDKPCPYWYKYKITNQPLEDCPLYMGGNDKCMSVPTYQEQNKEGKLWPCLDLKDYKKTWDVFQNNGQIPDDPYGYATCKGAFEKGECCLPQPGCLPMNGFNWIISTCKGKSCNDMSQYINNPNDTKIKLTTKARDEGSQVVVNYVAAFRYDKTKDNWVKQPYSSFNTNGKYPSYDLSKSQVNGWMPGPQPGGAAYWKYGWYPGGVGEEGSVGPPAMMFILSTEKCWNMAWYIMNQATLDRGPDKKYPNCHGGNTWACANSGEWDLLESSWSQTGLDEDGSYSNLFATMTNEGAAGRSLWPSYGKNKTGSGGFQKSCYIKGEKNKPQIFVAIIDKIGVYIYNLPVDDTSNVIWPGINSKTVIDILPARPSKKPFTSPCKDSSNFCCVFAPTSQGIDVETIKKTSSFAPIDKGFCGNYIVNNFVDTKQQWGETPVVLGGIKQPWNEEMECGGNIKN